MKITHIILYFILRFLSYFLHTISMCYVELLKMCEMNKKELYIHTVAASTLLDIYLKF